MKHFELQKSFEYTEEVVVEPLVKMGRLKQAEEQIVFESYLQLALERTDLRSKFQN